MTGQTSKKVSNCSKRSSFHISVGVKLNLATKRSTHVIFMYTFNGKDNDAMKALCKENGCELVIVPHNLTIKFYPLDTSIKAKNFISHKFNTWYAERVSTQLSHGIAPADVKVSMKLSELKPLHTKWIVELFIYLFLFLFIFRWHQLNSFLTGS